MSFYLTKPAAVAHVLSSSLFYRGISMRKFSETRLSLSTTYESKSAEKSSDAPDVSILEVGDLQ